MLRISEHIEFYKRDGHLSIIEKVKNWESYFQRSITNDCIALNNETKYASMSLKINEDQVDTKYSCSISSSYYVGLDRFPNLGLEVYVEPKLNTKDTQLDYVKILLEALQEPENFNHLDGLLTTKFNEEWIEIENDLQLLLTPFLIAQFLSVVKDLVKKGLKKSYYDKVENLNSRIRGKILVGAQIKTNVLKNQITKTVCKYQELGVDTEVNQFIKYVLSKVLGYLGLYDSNSELYKNLTELLNYCSGGFYQVSSKRFRSLKYQEKNPFYKNYNKAIQLGNQILALADHNISQNLDKDKSLHPPFWVDMSKLFELYVFKKLRERFPNNGEVMYHQKYNRQEPDFILKTNCGIKAVVDAKYKPRYKNGNPSMEDARQLAGYTRLNKIYDELNVCKDEIIPAYFIYPAELEFEQYKNDSDENFHIKDPATNSILDGEIRMSSTYNEMYLQEIRLVKY